MTDARVEMVSADAATARVFLDRAEGFLSDAAGGGMTASGRQICSGKPACPQWRPCYWLLDEG